MAKIGSSLLFQKDDVAKHYVGLLVQWNLSLFLIHKRKSPHTRVSMKPENKLFPSIDFDTNTDLHPIFKTAEDKKKFIVTGKIIDCDNHNIKLELIDLKEA